MKNRSYMLAVVSVLALALGYMLAMLADGLEQLSRCKADGLAECHLELDWPYLNAYGVMDEE